MTTIICKIVEPTESGSYAAKSNYQRPEVAIYLLKEAVQSCQKLPSTALRLAAYSATAG